MQEKLQQFMTEFPLQETTQLQLIAAVQHRFSQLFSFENIDVLLKEDHQITPTYLLDKLAVHRRGGVCYELNGLLYLVLKALKMDVRLGVATVWSDTGWIIDKTHTILFYSENGSQYVMDSGSGNNLSLQPIQIDGEAITSPSGTFRIRTKSTDRGTIVSEKLIEDEWILRYAFYPTEVTWDDLNRIKELVHHHPESPFREKILVAGSTAEGTWSINSDRLHQKWIDGREETVSFESKEQLIATVGRFSSEANQEAVKRYITSTL